MLYHLHAFFAHQTSSGAHVEVVGTLVESRGRVGKLAGLGAVLDF